MLLQAPILAVICRLALGNVAEVAIANINIIIDRTRSMLITRPAPAPGGMASPTSRRRTARYFVKNRPSRREVVMTARDHHPWRFSAAAAEMKYIRRDVVTMVDKRRNVEI